MRYAGRHRTRRGALCAASALATLLAAGGAWAQAPAPGAVPPADETPAAGQVNPGQPASPAGVSATASATPAVGEVVVTATRRTTTLQSTPLAITALDQNALQNNNITDLTKLAQQTPSLYVGGNDGFGGLTVQLRGIGSLDLGVGAEEGVGIYIDGVYQGKPYGNLFNFVDVSRIEVLRGPQGVLYGRNATGGAINIITLQPGNSFVSQANLEYTSYDGFNANGYILAPLVGDTLGLKVALGSSTRDGWAYDVVTHHHEVDGYNNKYASVSLRWRPTPTTDVVFAGRIGQSNDSQEQKDSNDKSLPIDVFHDDAPGYDSNRYLSGSVTLTQKVGTMSFVSITGYGASEATTAQDADLLPESLIYGTSFQKSRQETQELRLVSDANGRFTWLVGGLYYHEESSVTLPFVEPIVPGVIGGVLFTGALKTDSYSAYAEGTYKITPRLSFTAGARYSYDAKHWLGCEAPSPGSGFPSDSLCNSTNTNPDQRHFGDTTPHFVLDYQASRDVLLYASVTKGFRSGGWNFTQATSFHSGFTPEDIWSYEGGAKTELLQRRLKLNLAGYYADYSKLQVRVLDGPFLAVRNAGSARIYGVEFESGLHLLDRLDLSLVGAYLNAEYTNFPTQANGVDINYAGNRLSRAPKWDTTLAAQYEILLPGALGSLTPRAEYHYTGEVFYTPDNVQPLGANPTNPVNVRLRYQPAGQPWNVTAYADNLSNDQFRTYTVAGNLPGQTAARYSEPRIFGLRGQLNW